MTDLKSCVVFEPTKDDKQLERAIEKFIKIYGESPLEERNGTKS